MALTLTAPEPSTFIALEPDIYAARVTDVQVEDYTQVPDKYNKKGHHTFAFTFTLKVPDEDGNLQDMNRRAWLTFSLHEKATFPKLIAALGLDPIDPGDEVDPTSWIGLPLRISIQAKAKADQTMGDTIAGYYKAQPKKKVKDGAAAATPAAKRAAADVADEEEVVF